MKKIIALVLAVWMVFSLTGCSENMTSAERFLLAVKQMDFTAMKNELIPETKLGSLYVKLDSGLSLEEESMRALCDLYALVRYSVGEITEESGKEKTVEITLKLPDMQRIRDQVKAKVMVSAETAEKIVGDMLADGTIEKTLIQESTFSVKMIRTDDGEWKIPYEENKNFAEALAIENMIDFFIRY